MPKTVVRTNETIEDALKRFKKDVSKAGTLAELKRRKYFTKASTAKKLKKSKKRK